MALIGMWGLSVVIYTICPPTMPIKTIHQCRHVGSCFLITFVVGPGFQWQLFAACCALFLGQRLRDCSFVFNLILDLPSLIQALLVQGLQPRVRAE